MNKKKKTDRLRAGALGLALAFSITAAVPQYTVFAEEAQEQNSSAEQAEAALTAMPRSPQNAAEAQAVAEATKLYDALDAQQKDEISPGLRAKLTEAQQQAGVVNRTCGDITVSGDLPWYVQFTVEESDDMSAPSGYRVEAPYEMHLTNLLDGSDYDLNGQAVTVSMPKPEGDTYDSYTILHYLEDGSIEYITPAEQDGKLIFQTTSFSLFKLGGSNELVGGTHDIYEDAVRPSDSESSGSASSSSGTSSGSGNKNQASSGSGSNTSNGNSSSNKNSANAIGTVPETGEQGMKWLYGAGCAVSFLTVGGILIHIDLEKKRSRE